MNNLLIVINTCENYFKYNRISLLQQIKESKLSNVIIISGQDKKDIIEKRINENINSVYFPLLDLYKFQKKF